MPVFCRHADGAASRIWGVRRVVVGCLPRRDGSSDAYRWVDTGNCSSEWVVGFGTRHLTAWLKFPPSDSGIFTQSLTQTPPPRPDPSPPPPDSRPPLSSPSFRFPNSSTNTPHLPATKPPSPSPSPSLGLQVHTNYCPSTPSNYPPRPTNAPPGSQPSHLPTNPTPHSPLLAHCPHPFSWRVGVEDLVPPYHRAGR